MNKEKADPILEQFVKSVVASEELWGLQNAEGWASSFSVIEKELEVFPLWSEKTKAMACAVNNWKSYQAQQIQLTDFIENWCTGMYNEYIVAGINWNEKLSGNEIDPLLLALKLLEEVKRQKKELKLEHYENMDQLESVFRQALEEEEGL